MRLVNPENVFDIKLRYILFNKFDHDVKCDIFRNQKGNIIHLYTNEISKNGLMKSYKFHEDCYDFDHDTSATIENKNIDIYFDIGWESDDYNIFHFDLHTTYSEIVTQGKSRVIQTTCIDSKDNVVLEDGQFMVIIYPNNMLPPLVRVYNNEDFDIFNIDDEEAVSNSYFSNINLRTSTKTEIVHEDSKEQNNLPFLKFENDKGFQDVLQRLSQESVDVVDDKYYYTNYASNFRIEDNKIFLLDKVFMKDKEYNWNEISLDEINSKTLNFIYELSGNEDKITKSNVWYDKTNNTYKIQFYSGVSHLYSDTSIFINSFLMKENALIYLRYSMSYLETKTHLGCITLVDIEKERVISYCSFDLDKVRYWDEFNFTFTYQFDQYVAYALLGKNLDLNDIICTIFEVHNYFKDLKNEMENKRKFSYCQCNNTIIDDKKVVRSMFSEVLSGEDKNGKFVYIRGPIGELIPYYID